MLIIRNLNLISIQSWTYLFEEAIVTEVTVRKYQMKSQAIPSVSVCNYCKWDVQYLSLKCPILVDLGGKFFGKVEVFGNLIRANKLVELFLHLLQSTTSK